MSLDRELRTVLTEEAEVVAPSLPDIDGFIRGGRVRRRRRGMVRTGLTTVAVVLVAGGVYGVSQVERPDAGPEPGLATNPSATPHTDHLAYPGNGLGLASGTYHRTVGTTAVGTPIDVDITFDSLGWSASDQPVKGPAEDAGPYVGVGVLQVDDLPGTSGCMSTTTRMPSTFVKAPTTIDDLADAFASLPSSVVLEPVTTTSLLGHDARHLRVRVDSAVCGTDAAYVLAQGQTGQMGISYGSTQVVVDLTVVDRDGTPIVVAQWNNVDAPWNLVDEATRVRDSVRFAR